MDFLLHHMLRNSALRFPGKEALVHGEQRLNYGEVSTRVAGLSSGLRSAGVRRGERVGIYLEAGIAQVLAIFGVSQAGGVFVPVNTVLFPDQVAHIARDCGISVLITTASKLDSLLPAFENVHSLRFLVIVSEGGEPVNTAFPVHDFEAMTNAAPEDTLQDWGIEKDLAA